jgi:uncharacterized RDD family membrane protein YckC
MRMPERAFSSVRVRTPEGIEFAFELAGPVTRFLAWAVDLAAILVLLNLVLVSLRLLVVLSAGLGLALTILAYFLISVGYSILCEWRWGGQTLGKRLLRLRVVDEQGLPLRLPQLVLRNLLRAVDALPLLYLLGGLCVVLSPRLQRLGDLAAGTLVVRIPQFAAPDLSQVAPGKYCGFREHPHLAARLRQSVTPVEADLALQALLRREAFALAARVALFAALAEHFRSLVEFPQSATDGLSDEQYVRNVVAVVFQAGTAGRP